MLYTMQKQLKHYQTLHPNEPEEPGTGEGEEDNEEIEDGNE